MTADFHNVMEFILFNAQSFTHIYMWVEEEHLQTSSALGVMMLRFWSLLHCIIPATYPVVPGSGVVTWGA